jgi:hypothetical protein
MTSGNDLDVVAIFRRDSEGKLVPTDSHTLREGERIRMCDGPRGVAIVVGDLDEAERATITDLLAVDRT